MIVILKILAGSDDSDINGIPDVNGDGKIGLEEAVYVLYKLAGFSV